LTGTQVLLLVVSETGLVYTFTTAKLQPLVTKAEGKNLIQVSDTITTLQYDLLDCGFGRALTKQACLNAPDGFSPDGTPSGGVVPATKGKNGGLAIRPHKLTAAATAAMAASAQAQSAGAGHVSSDDHAQAQSDSQNIGNGTPSNRPKKRLPSGKSKKAMAAAGDRNLDSMSIPPVPSIPDIHRQSSPHSMMPLASPMSAGFHMPPEYHQHHQQSPSYGYPPTPQGGPDYGQYYSQPHPAQQSHQHHQGQQQGQGQQQQQQQQQNSPYGVNMHPSQAHLQYQREQQEHARLMMERQRGMGMGM
jgi:pheromone receptor transcription factor